MKYGCFDPKRVVNKYTGETVYVDCRNCDYCRNKRAYDLSSRIDREMLNPKNKSCYLITLDYDNEHLPVYMLDPEDGSWRSNRCDIERFPPISDVKEFYTPINYGYKYAFGHLCYPDVLAWFCTIRSRLSEQFGNTKGCNRQEIINDIFGDLTYEDVRFRYFLCGEYGPTTMRPHYHLLLWFEHSWNSEQESYLAKVFSKAWKNGSFDIQPVVNGGVKNYLASYVTSCNGVPRVLQGKSLRPFCTFSKNPTIGYYEVSEDEIQKILLAGAVERSRWDDKAKEFVPDVVSPSFYRRYFPRCTKFSYGDSYEKLRKYAYVFNYFKDLGIRHSYNDVHCLRLVDVSWPSRLMSNGEFVEWDYRDKYASMVCYRYCVMYGYTPEFVMRCIETIYSKLALAGLAEHYEELDESIVNNNNRISLMIQNWDFDFLGNLPVSLLDLELYQQNALLRYGIDLNYLYPDEILSLDVLAEFDYHTDSEYIRHCAECSSFHQRGIKVKKLNDYKRRVRDNRVLIV